MRSPHRNPPGRREDGFTLLEVLVALSLTALLLVLVLGGITSGRLALMRTEDANTEANLGEVQSLLRNMMAESRPLPFNVSGASEPVVFSGSASGISFVSSFAVQGQVSGLYANTLSLAPAGGGRVHLILRQRLFRPTGGNIQRLQPAEAQTQLIDNVAGLRVRYFGRLKRDEASQWVPSWHSTTALPELVEISLLFLTTDKRIWRPIVVPLAFAK